MTELTDAILIGPDPHFHTDAVLYFAGQVVPDVPVDWVSHEAYRQVVVDVTDDEGKVSKRTVAKPVRFRPISDEQKAEFRTKRERDLAWVDEHRSGPPTGFMAGP